MGRCFSSLEAADGHAGRWNAWCCGGVWRRRSWGKVVACKMGTGKAETNAGRTRRLHQRQPGTARIWRSITVKIIRYEWRVMGHIDTTNGHVAGGTGCGGDEPSRDAESRDSTPKPLGMGREVPLWIVAKAPTSVVSTDRSRDPLPATSYQQADRPVVVCHTASKAAHEPKCSPVAWWVVWPVGHAGQETTDPGVGEISKTHLRRSIDVALRYGQWRHPWPQLRWEVAVRRTSEYERLPLVKAPSKAQDNGDDDSQSGYGWRKSDTSRIN